MALELKKESLQADSSSEGSGGSSGIGDIGEILQEVNKAIDKFGEIQGQLPSQQQAQTQQGAGPQPMEQGQGNQERHIQKPDNSSQKPESVLQQLSPDQGFQLIGKGVQKVEDDIGEDATMAELEEYLIENQDDIKGLMAQMQQLAAQGNLKQLQGML